MMGIWGPVWQFMEDKPTFVEGQRVQLVSDQWDKRFRNKTGRVREVQWQTKSLGAPDGYWYLVDLDYKAITVTANSEGIKAID